MENQDNYWLNRFLKHKDKASEHLFYAIRRIDLLIISISGAGIYVVFETLRFVYKEPILLDVYYLKLAGCSFAAAIITNFFSQWAGYATNSYEEKYAEEEIKKERDEGFDKKKSDASKKWADFFDVVVSVLNVLATLAMLFGIVVLVFFNLYSF